MTARLLKACGNCGGVHPLARTPAVDRPDCPDCGIPLPPSDEVQTVKAALTGNDPLIRLARFFFDLAQKLTDFAKGL